MIKKFLKVRQSDYIEAQTQDRSMLVPQSLTRYFPFVNWNKRRNKGMKRISYKKGEL